RLHLTEERLDRLPDLGPHVDGAPPERPRMFAAWNRAPGVVVKQDELRPPVDRDREARSGADAERRAQALGPGLDWTERRRSPVEGTHSDSQVAAADERVARSGNCRHTRTRLWGGPNPTGLFHIWATDDMVRRGILKSRTQRPIARTVGRVLARIRSIPSSCARRYPTVPGSR